MGGSAPPSSYGPLVLLTESRRALSARVAELVDAGGRPAAILRDDRTGADFDALLSHALSTACGERVSVAGEPERLAWQIGAVWARRGRALSDVLTAYGVPLSVVLDVVRDRGRHDGDRHDGGRHDGNRRDRDRRAGDGGGDARPAQLELVGALFTVWNELTAAIACGYHTCAVRRPAADRQRGEFVRALLWGAGNAVEDFGDLLSTYGISETTGYHALRARPVGDSSVEELARAHGFVSGWRDDGGLCAVVDGKLVGFLTEVPPGDVPGVCGLGPRRTLGKLSESFRMASRALTVADRRGLVGFHEFGNLGLLAAGVPADDAVGRSLAGRYLRPLGGGESAAEILDTVYELLLNGMHVARTAERIFVHPNTVRYRIARFEELTGVNLRTSPLTMFEVLWALEYRAAQQGAIGAGGSLG